jgi:hypothetical protein
MKSYLSVIFLRTSEVDLMMSTVQISTPEDSMPLVTEAIHILRELTIEDELPLPCLFTLSTIWEVDAEDVYHIFFLRKSEMRDSSLVRGGIRWKCLCKCEIIHLIHSLMYPDTRSSISCFFGRIIERDIVLRGLEFQWDLIVTCLDLLHKYNIRIIGRDELGEFSLVIGRTDAIHVPGDDAHIIYVEL